MDGNVASGMGMIIVGGMVCFFLVIIMGIYGIVDYFFIKEKFETTELIQPDIQLILNDNKVDTVYIYREP